MRREDERRRGEEKIGEDRRKGRRGNEEGREVKREGERRRGEDRIGEERGEEMRGGEERKGKRGEMI